MGNYWHNILNAVGIKIGDGDLLLQIDEDMFNTDEFPNILVNATPEKLIINRDELLNSFDKYFTLHEKVCPVFSKESYVAKLRTFPEHIEIARIDVRSLQEKRNQEMEIAFDQRVEEIVAKIGEEMEKRFRKVLGEYFKKL